MLRCNLWGLAPFLGGVRTGLKRCDYEMGSRCSGWARYFLNS